MLKQFLKRIIDRFLAYYGCRCVPLDYIDNGWFTLHSYVLDDGSFDYEKYRQIQTRGNKQKIDNVWVLEENIAFLADYIRNSNTDVPQFGICHGTRRGKEQEWFSKYLGCKVIGTEISDTAENFPNTLQWDFHETKAEWIDAVDFVYSNSFDHSYDPEECLNAWMSCVKSGGICIIEHTSKHSPLSANQLDPFGAHLVVMPYLIARWGKGQYGVHELVEAPAKRDNTDYVCFIIVKRFDS